TLAGLATGSWMFVASHEGYATSSGWANDWVSKALKSGAKPVRIVLSPGIDVAGRVVNHRGEPVAGIDVRSHAQTSNWQSPESTPRSTTGADGEFVLH